MNKYTIGIAIGLFLPFSAFAAPTITLVGGSVVMNQSSSYQEPGYSAFDAIDGVITSLVNITNGVNANVPGDYSVRYSVTNSSDETANASRAVTVTGGGVSNPCNWNGTCPCPINPSPIDGNPIAWKACVMLRYPKTADGSTLVCRLKPLQPLDNNVIQCAPDQAGFGEMLIKPDGTEVTLW